MKRHHTSYYCQGTWFCCKRSGKYAEGCQSGMFGHHLGYFNEHEDQWTLCKCMGRSTLGCKPGLININLLTSKKHYDEDRESEYVDKISSLYQYLWKDQHHPGLFKDSIWQCCMNRNIYAQGCQDSKPIIKHHDNYYHPHNPNTKTNTLTSTMMMTTTITNTNNDAIDHDPIQNIMKSSISSNTIHHMKNSSSRKNVQFNHTLNTLTIEDNADAMGIWLCCKNPIRTCIGCVDGLQNAYSLLINFDHPEIDHILTMPSK